MEVLTGKKELAEIGFSVLESYLHSRLQLDTFSKEIYFTAGDACAQGAL